MEFIEAPAFTRHVHEYLNDKGYRTLQAELAANPELGDVSVRYRRLSQDALG